VSVVIFAQPSLKFKNDTFFPCRAGSPYSRQVTKRKMEVTRRRGRRSKWPSDEREDIGSWNRER